MNWFRKQVVAIENEAKHFIDDSFKALRSAEGAFDMLLNFRHIRSRDAINSQMMRKFNDILLQFEKEVRSINDRFSFLFCWIGNRETARKLGDAQCHKIALFRHT